MARAHVIVVGCGVIGLSSAITLRESGLDVWIVTAAPPHETTSSVAAALWYPYRAYPEDRVLSWGQRTFEVFEDLAKRRCLRKVAYCFFSPLAFHTVLLSERALCLLFVVLGRDLLTVFP